MQIEVLDSLSRIDADDWNALVGPDCPMLRHEFLFTLEDSGCACADTGWAPHHLVAHAGDDLSAPIVGAVPMYIKGHSYGEYVFDWAWANAWERAGHSYYPKLLVASPFTPVGGDRLLVHPEVEREPVARALVRAALSEAKMLNVSSLHWIFTNERDTALLEDEGLMRRSGTQFHWHNQDYTDFDAFLAAFSSARRKNIRRERRRVYEAGIRFHFVEGDGLNDSHWDRFHDFYRRTTQRYGAIAYLNRSFFRDLGRRMARHCLLLFAERDGVPLAGAFFLRGDNALYGRYWGTLEDVDGLHFETCYYRPIEYCIDHGLARFEAGAQGEHKLYRGLLPATTHSAHWLRHPQFAAAVSDFLVREAEGVARYDDVLRAHSPFRRDGPGRPPESDG